MKPDVKTESVPQESYTQSVDVNGQEYVYLMTSDWNAVVKKIRELGCRAPVPQDWRWNPALHQNVRDKMAELGTRYSMTTSNGASVVNSYSPNSIPLIMYLSDLYTEQKKVVQVCNSLGRTVSPLFYACAVGSAEGVRLLIEHKVDVNARDENGFTALMLASALNRKEIVRLLIQNGADMSLRSNSGFYALTFACVTGANDAVQELENAGAQFLEIPLFVSKNKEKMPFKDKLQFYIQKSTLLRSGKEKKIAYIYKRANMSRQQFSKIMNAKSNDYRPQKNTIVQLAIGLQLTLAQTMDLLESAGYFLLPDDEFDSIVSDFIARLDYDIDEIDAELFRRTGKTLCSYE